MIEELLLWAIFFYIVYRVIKSSIRSAVNRGMRDYEARKESQQRKEKEVKIDRSKVEDAKFKDLQ